MNDILPYIKEMIPFNYICLIALCIAVWYHFQRKRNLPHLLLFLIIVNFIEIFLIMYWTKQYKSNVLIYNIYSIFCVCYYLYIYFHHFWEKTWTKKFIFLSIFWFIFAVSLFVHNFNVPTVNTSSYNIGMIMVIGLVLKYYYDLIYVDNYRSIAKEPLFYFSLGLLIFYVSSFPLLNFVNFFVVEDTAMITYVKLLQIGNIFLSLGYLGAALCSKKQMI
ncbi:MAG: hypothetical protein KA270_09915 [Saprospiraceae bacterium]|jgi:hypothetical protein|nr:hypothetical protein [Saprospiraceae bacterium]MBP6567473.1 hypothetical protein [Saprospiraceae bacterium]